MPPSREITGRLFDDEPAPDQTADDQSAPLAERMRPRTLDEFVGQAHVVGEGTLLRRLIEGTGTLPSLLLWGGARYGQDVAGATARESCRRDIHPALGRILGGPGGPCGDRRGPIEEA